MSEIKKKSGNLYDMPFEKRIRIKYTILGLLLGMVLLSVLALVDIIMKIVLSYLTSKPISFRGDGSVGLACFIMFIPLLYYVWYSKAKPPKKPELDETIGLKTDWDKVNRV